MDFPNYTSYQQQQHQPIDQSHSQVDYTYYNSQYQYFQNPISPAIPQQQQQHPISCMFVHQPNHNPYTSISYYQTNSYHLSQPFTTNHINYFDYSYYYSSDHLPYPQNFDYPYYMDSPHPSITPNPKPLLPQQVHQASPKKEQSKHMQNRDELFKAIIERLEQMQARWKKEQSPQSFNSGYGNQSSTEVQSDSNSETTEQAAGSNTMVIPLPVSQLLNDDGDTGFSKNIWEYENVEDVCEESELGDYVGNVETLKTGELMEINDEECVVKNHLELVNDILSDNLFSGEKCEEVVPTDEPQVLVDVFIGKMKEADGHNSEFLGCNDVFILYPPSVQRNVPRIPGGGSAGCPVVLMETQLCRMLSGNSVVKNKKDDIMVTISLKPPGHLSAGVKAELSSVVVVLNGLVEKESGLALRLKHSKDRKDVYVQNGALGDQFFKACVLEIEKAGCVMRQLSGKVFTFSNDQLRHYVEWDPGPSFDKVLTGNIIGKGSCRNWAAILSPTVQRLALEDNGGELIGMMECCYTLYSKQLLKYFRLFVCGHCIIMAETVEVTDTDSFEQVTDFSQLLASLVCWWLRAKEVITRDAELNSVLPCLIGERHQLATCNPVVLMEFFSQGLKDIMELKKVQSMEESHRLDKIEEDDSWIPIYSHLPRDFSASTKEQTLKFDGAIFRKLLHHSAYFMIFDPGGGRSWLLLLMEGEWYYMFLDDNWGFVGKFIHAYMHIDLYFLCFWFKRSPTSLKLVGKVNCASTPCERYLSSLHAFSFL